MKGKKTGLAILIGAVILLLGASVLLFQSVSQFRDVSGQLNNARLQLESFYQRNPFPSEENIEAEQEHLQALRRELAALRNELSANQVEPVQTAPVRFVERFRNISRRLAEQAAERRIDVPPDFAFGFEHHRAGELPNPADVPRLMQQLGIVEQLVNVLYDVGIAEITRIQRQEFEVRESAEDRPERRGLYGAREPSRRDPTRRLEAPPGKIGILEDDADYASLNFVLEFRLHEYALLDVLNALAKHPMFIVVNRVELRNPFEWQPARAITAGDPANGQDAMVAPLAVDPRDMPSRSERVVTGEFPRTVHVTLELEVYRFREDETS